MALWCIQSALWPIIFPCFFCHFVRHLGFCLSTNIWIRNPNFSSSGHKYKQYCFGAKSARRRKVSCCDLATFIYVTTLVCCLCTVTDTWEYLVVTADMTSAQLRTTSVGPHCLYQQSACSMDAWLMKWLCVARTLGFTIVTVVITCYAHMQWKLD